MTIPAYVLLGLCVLVSLVWTTRHLLINRERRKGFELTGEYSQPPADAPRLSVLIAAKDEEDNIAACLESLVAQDYPNFEVIVCNDRSTDRTGEIVRQFASRDERIKLVDVDHLPDGWMGKSHALSHGVKEATGDWLCLIDADCVQENDSTLTVARQYAEDTDADLLSLLPHMTTKTFWEKLIQPVCSGVMMIWYKPEQVNNPNKPNAAYANGAFMLFKRDSYEAVGGHESIKQIVNEDIHLARRIKSRSDMRLRVARTDKLYSVRMYTGLREIINGWTRIFYGAFHTTRRMIVSWLLVAVMGLLPYFVAPVGLAAWSAGADEVWLWAGLAGLLAAVLQLSVIFRFYGLAGGDRRMFWTYPIASLFVLWIITRAFLKTRKGASLRWKGTAYANPAQY
ncbi:MAG: glycosyltransferase [Phycisphaerae bacterium]